MDEYRRHVLRRLLRRRCIGDKHTAIEHCYGGIARHAVIAAKIATHELINEGYIILKPTEYGTQVSLNPQRLPEIRSMIEEE